MPILNSVLAPVELLEIQFKDSVVADGTSVASWVASDVVEKSGWTVKNLTCVLPSLVTVPTNSKDK